jgi:hypothetical protein
MVYRLTESDKCGDAEVPVNVRTDGAGGAELRALGDEVAHIARRLTQVSERMTAEPKGPAGPITADYVRSIVQARRLRDARFPRGLFGDPAWDMMLDLLIARIEGERVAVTALSTSAAVPASTTLRWIKTLCDHGLVVRSADANDGRRIFVALTDSAAERLMACLAETRASAGLPI